MKTRPFLQTLKTLIPPLLIACIALGCTAWFQMSAERRVREQAYEQLSDITAVQDTAMSATLEGSYSILEAVAGTLALQQSLDRAVVLSQLISVEQNSDFLHACVADAQGMMTCSDGRLLDISDRAYFHTAMAGVRSLEKVENGRLDFKTRFILAVPIIDSGRPVGVMMGSYSEERFAALFLDAFSTRQAYSFLTDASGKGVAIASSQRTQAVGGGGSQIKTETGDEAALNDFKRRVAEGVSGQVAYTWGGGKWQAAYRPLSAPEFAQNGWALFHAETEASVAEKAIAVKRDGAALSSVILACAVGLIALYVSLRRRKERELLLEQQRLKSSEEIHTLVEDMTESILFDADIKLDTLRFNRRFRDAFGREPSLSRLSDVYSPPPVVHSDDLPAWQALCDDLRANKPSGTQDVRLLRGDRSYAWYRIEYMLLLDAAGAPARIVGKLSGVDAEKKRMLRLQSQASRDALTGLLNQEALREQITQTLSDGDAGHTVLMLIDLDSFRQINALYGHTTGDEALAAAARRIRETLPQTAILGRVGGDEFAALLCDVADEHAALEMATRLLEAIPPTLRTVAPDALVSASIGLASRGTDGSTFEELFQAADLALYQVKCQGRNGCAFVSGPGRRKVSSVTPRGWGFGDNPGIPLYALMMYMEGGVIIMEMARPMRILYASPSYAAMPGMPEDDIDSVLRDPMRRVYPQDAPALESALRNGAESGEVVDEVFRVWTETGEKWHHMRAVRIPYPNSACPVVIAVLMDITEQHRASAQLSAIVRSAPMGILLLERGETARALFVSEAVENLFAARPDALRLLREDALRLLNADEREAFRRALSDVVPDGPAVEIDFSLPDAPTPEGMWVSARMVYLERREEHDVILAMITNATQRREAERAREQNRERLRTANERMAAAIAQTQALLFEVSVAEKTITWWDCDGERMKMDGLPDSLLAAGMVHPESAVELFALFRDIAEGREDGRHVLRARMQQGGYLWARAGYRFAETADAGRVAVGALTPLPRMEASRADFDREAAFAEAISKRALLTARLDLVDDAVELMSARDERFYRSENSADCDALLCAVVSDADEAEREALSSWANRDALLARMERGDTWAIQEFTRNEADGRRRAVCLSVHLMTEPASGHLYAFLYLSDVDDRHRWREALDVPVERDVTSGVYARQTAVSMMRGLLDARRADALDLPVLGGRAMLLLEVANFQRLFETRGIHAVARLIRFLGRTLGGWLDGASVVGRMDNRRFGVLLPGAHEPTWLRLEVGRIMSVLTAHRLSPIPPEEIEYALGIGWMPVEYVAYEELTALAETALNRALSRRAAPGETRIELLSEREPSGADR